MGYKLCQDVILHTRTTLLIYLCAVASILHLLFGSLFFYTAQRLMIYVVHRHWVAVLI